MTATPAFPEKFENIKVIQTPFHVLVSSYMGAIYGCFVMMRLPVIASSLLLTPDISGHIYES